MANNGNADNGNHEHAAFKPQRRESGMMPGESQEANQVVSTVLAAKNLMLDTFDVKAVLESTKYAKLPELEKAYVAKRLKDEAGVIMPKALLPSKEAVQELIDAQVKVKTPRAPVERTASEEEEPEPTAEETMNGLFRLIQRRFAEAQEQKSDFSIDQEIAQYAEELDSAEMLTTLRAKLRAAGVTDLSAPVEEVAVGQGLAGRDRVTKGQEEFARFEYKDGKLHEVWTSGEGEDAREATRLSRSFTLPPEFDRLVASDMKKLDKFLGGLDDLFRDLRPNMIKLVPLRADRRRDGKITGFAVKFMGPGVAKAMGPGYQEEVETASEMLAQVNAEEAKGEKYYESSVFKHWREEVRERAREHYKKRNFEDMLRWFMDKSDPEQEAKPFTPADVGLGPEQSQRLKGIVREALVKSYATALREKYPRMDEEHARKTADMILEDTTVETAYQAQLKKMQGKK